MKGIGNPDMKIPFSFEYSKNQYKCLQGYQNYKQPSGMGCKLTYIQGLCKDIATSPKDNYLKSYSDWGVGCAKWTIQEKNNFKNLCWKKNYQVVKLEDVIDIKRNYPQPQTRCVISYKKGCSAQPKCQLYYGNGNPTNRNIIITSDDDNEQLSLVTSNILTYVLKNSYPFNKYSNKFNVYRITNVSILHTPSYYMYYDPISDSYIYGNTLINYSEIFSSCGITLGDVMIPSKTTFTKCPRWAGGCMWFLQKPLELSSVIDVGTDFYGDNPPPDPSDGIYYIGGGLLGNPYVYTHELMHSGGAIGESYGENPQMWTDASVQNVINWINRK